MTRQPNLMAERRQALDAAIAALDEDRNNLIYDRGRTHNKLMETKYTERIDALNRYIATLTAMREVGSLL